MPLSKDAKWIIGILLAFAGVTIAAMTGVWGLARTLATKSDIADLATTGDVERVGARLDTIAEALQETVDGLGATVGRLEATVDGLGATVGRLEATVNGLQGAAGRFQETTDAVNVLIGRTLPAVFTCMVEIDRARAAEDNSLQPDGVLLPDGRQMTAGRDLTPPLPHICDRLRLEIAAVETPLVPLPPD